MKYFREKFIKKIVGVWYTCYLYHGRNGYDLRITSKNTYFNNHLKGKEAIYVTIDESKIKLSQKERQMIEKIPLEYFENLLKNWLECQEFNKKNEPIQLNLFE